MDKPFIVDRLEEQRSESKYISQVYSWMSVALLITAGISYFVGHSEYLLSIIYSSSFVFYGLILAELGLVFYISSRIESLSGCLRCETTLMQTVSDQVPLETPPGLIPTD